jgi:twinkle protein
MGLHQRHKEWIEGRGISAELAEKLGLSTVQKDGKAWLSVPYVERGTTVNHKYRLISEKRHQMDKGGRLTLWNHDCLLEDSKKPVVICEGEWDALTAIQAGYRAVSVPNGASGGEGKLDYLWDARDLLNRVESFILATDSDEAGLKLRANLVAHLGADRCSFVEYGADCKDLNETLNLYGPDAARDVLDNAKTYPVKGLYRLADFPDAGPVESMPLGIDCMKDKIEIVPGTLTIFTGFANMGKSTVLNTILAHAVAHEIPCCVASFETAPKPILRDGIARAMIGCSFHEFPNHPLRAGAYDEIERHIRVISNALDEEVEFDIDSFLETARVSVLRDGVKIVVLDPWNELEHKRNRDESLTEYVGRAIRRVKTFARRYNVAFWIVAHPTKPQRGQADMPSLYDVSDSANWANKADYGLVYHRPDKTINEAALAVVKVRMGLPGQCGVERVMFDHRTSRITGAA